MAVAANGINGSWLSAGSMKAPAISLFNISLYASSLLARRNRSVTQWLNEAIGLA